MTVVPRVSKQDELGVLVAILCDLGIEFVSCAQAWDFFSVVGSWELTMLVTKLFLPSSEVSVLIMKQCHLLKFPDTKGPTDYLLGLS